MSDYNNISDYRNSGKNKLNSSMNIIKLPNNQNEYKNQDKFKQTLKNRQLQNRYNENTKDTISLPNWTTKTPNWFSASGRFSSMSISSMLGSSLNNLSISAFNYKLEFANFQFLKVHPIDFANQITLIDVKLFSNIKQEEIFGFGWKTPKKSILAPNITAYTRRFNQISFWTINEILLANFKHNSNFKNLNPAAVLSSLSETESIKCRTEILAHFIKIAKKLYSMNNIQSCYAIISALNSSSIYRLTKTWNQLSKKDKKTFEEISSLFSEQNNFENLRNHLKNIKGSCIPYLGMYFKDLIYIDTAHPKDKKNTVNFQREMKLREIVQQILASYTTSCYDNLVEIPPIKNYLQSINYVEELQKFMEEDYYKLSLKLEPVESKLSKSTKMLYDDKNSTDQSTFYISSVLYDENSYKSPKTNFNNSLQVKNKSFHNDSSFTLDQLKNQNDKNSTANSTFTLSKNFIPSHRKSSSLGSNVILHNRISSTESFNKKPNVINYENRYLIDDALLEENLDLNNSFKQNGIKFNKVPSLCSMNSQTNNGHKDKQQSDQQSITITNSSTSFHKNHDYLSACESSTSVMTKNENLPSENEYNLNLVLPEKLISNILYQGYIKRKTYLKEGKKPTLSTWIRYWLVLNTTSLIFYSSKTLRGCYRSHFKSTPSKYMSLRSSLINVKLDEESYTMDVFSLIDDNEKTVYKFKTNTQLEAITWYREIASVLSNPSF